MKRRSLFLFALVPLLGGALFVGCDNSLSCDDSLTCNGDAATGGSRGMGGMDSGGMSSAGGPPVEPACDSDAECSDGLRCNGEEKCVNGSCEAGTDPCSELEEEGCVVSCAEGKSAAACSVAAEDADEDGHVASDNTCSADPELPRDDCDDEDDTAHPGAEELCDGVDNNCNGVDDFGDGLGLGGSVITIASGTVNEIGGVPMVTWSEELQIWVVVAATGDDLRFWRFEPDGTEIDRFFDLTPGTGARESGYLDAAWQGDTMLLSYGGDGGSTNAHELVRLQFSGDQFEPQQLDTPQRLGSTDGGAFVEVVSVPQGWGAYYLEGGTVGHLLRMNPSGATIPPIVALDPVGFRSGLGAAGDRLTAAWWEPDGVGDDFTGFRLVYSQWGGDQLNEVVPKTILIPASTAELSYGGATVTEAGDDAFIFTRKASTALSVVRIDSEGEIVCGPVELPGGVRLFGGGDVLSFSTNETTGIFLTADDEVYRVPTNCNVPTGLDVTFVEPLGGSPLSQNNQNSASGSRGHAVVWNEPDGELHLRMRLFGNAICDDIE